VEAYATVTVPKFRIAVDINNLLVDGGREPVKLAAVKGMTLREAFPSIQKNWPIPDQK
jgi:hypothetical protein